MHNFYSSVLSSVNLKRGEFVGYFGILFNFADAEQEEEEDSELGDELDEDYEDDSVVKIEAFSFIAFKSGMKLFKVSFSPPQRLSLRAAL